MKRRWASPLLGGEGGKAAPALRGRRLRLADYLAAPLHHPWWVLVPLVISVTVATAAAFLLPKRYTASCLVLIKASGVPEKIIANVANELDARRYQTIRQEILSRTRLEKVNEELHPYPGTASPSAAVAALQRAIQVNFKGSDAFSIEFSHRDRHLTQVVTNRLATLFIDEFRRARRAQVEGAADFLDQELKESRERLDGQEEALRKYKERNMGRLPEQLEASLATLQRLQLELQGVEQSLESAEARLDRLNSHGTSAEPASGASATGPSEREVVERELARLRERYTDEHPDIQALLARLRAIGRDSAPSATGPDHSTIVSGQIERARADVNALLVRRNDLRNQITSLQGRVEQMPRTEQELGGLTRDFNQLRDNYQTLLRKRMEAQTAERLQQRWTEDFEILDPARLPEHHTFPNRPLFMLAGMVLGLGLGLGAALLAEHFNSQILTLEDLESLTTTPILGVLPFVESAKVARDASARPRDRSVGLSWRDTVARLAPGDGRRRAKAPMPLLLGAAALVLLGAGVGFYFAYPGGGIPSAPSTLAPPPTLGPEGIAAQQRVKELEERLASLEEARRTAEAQAADDAKRKVEAQARAKGQAVDPAALQRARQDEEGKQREELLLLENQKQAEEARLPEEGRRANETTAAPQAPDERTPDERAAGERAEEEPGAQASGATSAPPTAQAPPPPASEPPPTTAAALPPGMLVNLSDPGVIPPVLETKPSLIYPPTALLQRAQGIVRLSLLVDERGDVTEARIVSAPQGRAGLSEAAQDYARRWKYRSATKDGIPVKVRLLVQVRFELPQ